MESTNDKLDKKGREPLLRALFAECGLTYEDTAGLIGCSAMTLQNDVRGNGGMTAFAPDRPMTSEAYAVGFRKYAKLEAHKWEEWPYRRLEGMDAKICLMLRTWLGIQEIEMHMGEQAKILSVLLTPEYRADQTPYFRLLCASRALWNESDRSLDVDGVMSKILRGIATGSESAPADAAKAKMLFARGLANSARDQVLPTWPDDAAKRVDGALERLSLREREFLRRNYGIGCEPENHRSIAAFLGLKVTQIPYLERSSLRHLRQSPEITPLVVSMGAAVNCVIESIKPELAEPDPGYDHPLSMRVIDANFSFKVENILKGMGLKYLWQLVGTNEERFGPPTLGEIKTLLGRHGLSMGMELTDEHRTEYIRKAAMPKPVEPESEYTKALYERMDEQSLTVRTASCIQNAGIEYIWQLVEKSEAEMLRMKNFGRGSLNEVKDLLCVYGLSLGMRLTNFPRNAPAK